MMATQFKMHKRGDFVVIGVAITFAIVVTLLAFQGVLEGKIGATTYVGDSSTMKYYNIKSTNPECDLNQVNITKNNLVYFYNEDQANASNFTIDEKCK